MTTPNNLVQLAQSLKDNEAFQAVLDTIRTEALENLAAIPADNKNGILKLQATVSVVDDIRDNLGQLIRSGVPPKQPGIA